MRKFIYLISPSKIDKKFFKDFPKVLSSNKVKYFQIRLKKQKEKKVIKLSRKIRKITKKYKVKLIMNDSINLAKKINADGCHLGQKDELIKTAKKKLKGKIIGSTCHNSKKFCLEAKKNKASYIALGAFAKSKLKPKAIKANISILRWAHKKINKPLVAIGGINNKNYKRILNAGANYIALSSYIWNNPRLKPYEAIKKFNYESISK